ncbi:hypothetical protein NQ317_010525 [Molorchus minor]|uniref:Gamma-interferon-inducible lysosomal thiol reductase n=1 Tax=Molorchus minor TaxID=1323400 RepID=A0ABQ9JY45_9CUCU|nr:hypothetical protein NQ317_010525 [Molorchus minor]
MDILLFYLFRNFKSYLLQDTVKVSLYYAALCPFSQDFIANQLYPGYQTLGDSLNLELVPYGNSKVRYLFIPVFFCSTKKVHEKWQLTCQHGPKECYANKLQACVLGMNYTQERSMNFIGCVMSTDSPQQNANARKCANKNKMSWRTVKDCANGERGNELFVYFGEITSKLNPPLDYVPYILFNDVHNKTVEEAAREDFLTTVCSLYQEKPIGC